MKNNVSKFSRYIWMKNMVRNHLARRGHTDAQIRAAVLHAIQLLAKGHGAFITFQFSTFMAIQRRAEELILPYTQPPHNNGPGAA